MAPDRRFTLAQYGFLLAGCAVWAWTALTGRSSMWLYLGPIVFVGNFLMLGWRLWKDAERRDKEHERFLVQKRPDPR